MDAGARLERASVHPSPKLGARRAYLKFLLDEDPPPLVAEVARALGLDVKSVHELERTGLPDPEQPRYAAHECRILVTRNRNDSLHFTAEFYLTCEPHYGVLIASQATVE